MRRCTRRQSVRRALAPGEHAAPLRRGSCRAAAAGSAARSAASSPAPRLLVRRAAWAPCASRRARSLPQRMPPRSPHVPTRPGGKPSRARTRVRAGGRGESGSGGRRRHPCGGRPRLRRGVGRRRVLRGGRRRSRVTHVRSNRRGSRFRKRRARGAGCRRPDARRCAFRKSVNAPPAVAT